MEEEKEEILTLINHIMAEWDFLDSQVKDYHSKQSLENLKNYVGDLKEVIDELIS